MKTYEQANAAYQAYLAGFNADHPNNEQYRPVTVSEHQMPSIDKADALSFCAWRLLDGRVVKLVFNGHRSYCEIYPSVEAFNNFREPLSSNQYYYG